MALEKDFGGMSVGLCLCSFLKKTKRQVGFYYALS
jgi:hypothetical protein